MPHPPLYDPIEEDDEPDYSNFSDAENLKYLRFMERRGLVQSSLGPDDQIVWEMTALGQHLQDQNKLPFGPYDDVLH